MPSAPHFTPEGLTFLANIVRHNDRAWFEANKPTYESAVKAPFLALLGALNDSLAEFAPAHVRPPQKTMMRIYRDTRFSANKAPYKTQVAAWWAREGLEKTSGAGFYLSLSASELTIAAGAYMPAPEQLLAIRRYLLDHHQELRDLLADKKLRAKLREFDSQKLTRAPKGFAPDHPAGDLLLHRQWGVSAVLPATAALVPTLMKEIVPRFRLAAPLVDFLNTPLAPKLRNPMF